jgi:hypothetical protein
VSPIKFDFVLAALTHKFSLRVRCHPVVPVLDGNAERLPFDIENTNFYKKQNGAIRF